MRILVLGASGMLGSAMFRTFGSAKGFDVWGTARSTSALKFFDAGLREKMLVGVDVEKVDALLHLFSQVRPDVVVNCVGLVKQLSNASAVLDAVPLNSVLPHRLASLCSVAGARLVHISTDCVFSGKKGEKYGEGDTPDAYDVYGRSKLLGEVDYVNAITLRTSIIGHELDGNRSLIDWFLSQEGSVRGYAKAIFSGLPTVELANVVKDYVINRPELHGVYHVSVDPINKYELLKLVADVYKKRIEVHRFDDFVIDRSLDSSRFQVATGYTPPKWPELIQKMREFG